MGKIKVAIIGVGNCASSLIQGIEYYKDVDENSVLVPGLMNNVFGSYKIRDIKVVAAFDVNMYKVGKDLSEAIFTEPNCTLKFCQVPKLNVKVEKGPLLDGLGENLKKIIPVDEGQKEINISKKLRETNTEILINYLPVGSKEATKFYAHQAIEAGCSFINAIPEFIASDPKWIKKFEEAGLPLAGDDIKSQVGASIVHRSLIDLFVKRGVTIEETYQLNIGGNSDFLNISEKQRSETKTISKTETLQSLIPYKPSLQVISDNYVKFKNDSKDCYIYLKGKEFGGAPVTIELKLSVEDSPNSAGVMIDVIRAVKTALDIKRSGVLTDICAYFFKYPIKQYTDDEARRMVKNFIKKGR